MKKELFYPRYWLLWTAFGFMRLFVCLPFKWQMKTGAFLAKISLPFLKRRKEITLINLRLCFPEKNSKEIDLLCKKSFESLGYFAVETIISWFMPSYRFKKINVKFDCPEEFTQVYNNKEKAIVLGCHFTSFEVIGRYISENYSRFAVVYQKHKNPLFEYIMTSSREKYGTTVLQRKNVLSIVKAIKRSLLVWYAPDQDFGNERSIFVPFFKIPCATLTSTSWLSEKSGAKVFPCYYIRREDLSGYDLYLMPFWKDFPSGDDYADARRYNAFLEEVIVKHPEQYLWQHRRFKSRPENEKRFY